MKSSLHGLMQQEAPVSTTSGGVVMEGLEVKAESRRTGNELKRVLSVVMLMETDFFRGGAV